MRTAGGQRTRVFWKRSGALLALAAVALFLASCEATSVGRDPGPQDDIGEQAEDAGEPGSTGSESGVGFAELTDNPDEFYGETVTVSATVARVIEEQAFSIVSDEPPGDEEPVEDEAVLVVSERGAHERLYEEETVRVTGEVRRFDLAEIERELDVDLDDSLSVDYGERPVIIAQSAGPLAEETA